MEKKHVQSYFFIILLLATTVLFMWVVSPFFQSIFWALTFAIVFQPLYLYFLKLLPARPASASLLTLVSIIILVAGPLYTISTILVSEAQNLYTIISSPTASQTRDTLSGHILGLADTLEGFGIHKETLIERVDLVIDSLGGWLVSTILVLGQNVLRFAVVATLTLYILFFFLRDGEKMLSLLKHIVPLSEDRKRTLFERFASVTRASMKGEFMIALLQGILGGLLFWITGIQSPALWGFIMGVLSLLPALGTGIVWFPAALFLLFTGNILEGVMVLIGGAIFVSLIDNIIRPRLVGKDAELPDLFVLISTLGGLILFGVSGLILGPVIAGLFLSMWQMYHDEIPLESL